MNKKADLLRKCHNTLGELSKYRQLPFLDHEVKNRLVHDGAIKDNGLYGIITPKGDDLLLSSHYLELAEEAENKEREKELRERDSFASQRLVEEDIKQTSIESKNYKATIISIFIAVIGVLLGLVKGCQ